MAMTQEPLPAGVSAQGGPGPYGRLAVDRGLSQALLTSANAGRSVFLQVTGEPGGVVHLVDGGVVAIETPGAPDAETVLLRSGLIPEPGWDAAFTAAAASGRLAAEIVQQGLIGAARLEAVLRIVLADAMFVLAVGRVEECHVVDAAAPSLLALEPGAEPRRLLDETSRRLQVLAAMGSQITHDRDRVTAGAWQVTSRLPLSDSQRDILALANGRRTARDMAFALGRGVFALTLEFSRLHELGLLVVGSRRGGTPAGQADRAGSPAGPNPHQAADPAAGPGKDPVSPLPRRRAPSQPGETSPARAPQAPPALLRILRRGPSGPQVPADPEEPGRTAGQDAP